MPLQYYVVVSSADNTTTIESAPVAPTKLAVGGLTRPFENGKTTIDIVATCTKGGTSAKFAIKVEIEVDRNNNPTVSTTITKAK